MLVRSSAAYADHAGARRHPPSPPSGSDASHPAAIPGVGVGVVFFDYDGFEAPPRLDLEIVPDGNARAGGAVPVRGNGAIVLLGVAPGPARCPEPMSTATAAADSPAQRLRPAIRVAVKRLP